MSNIPVNDNPEFSQNMEALTPQTPAHADVFNAFFSQLLNNDYYLSLLVEKLAENLANHFEDYVAHITADERISWNNTLDNAKEYSDGAYQQATGYTDLKISQLINGAPETLDTLKEVADAIEENENVVDALDAAIGTKASQAEFDTHAGNSTIHITAAERTNWNSKANGSHTHSYAGSSSAGGAANSAVKLQTPRTITIGNQSQPFDGASNIAFTASDMGLAEASHTHSYLPLSGGSVTNSLGVHPDNNSSDYATLQVYASNYGALVLTNNSTKHYSRTYLSAKHDNTNVSGTVITVSLPTSGGTLSVASSDIRLKEHIEDAVINALDVVNSIKFRQFDWKDTGKHQDIGFVVDELEEIDPHLKLDGTGGYVRDDLTDEEKQNVENMNVKCVDTFYLMGYYGKAIQELYSIIQKQQKEIINLKKLVEEKGGQM